MALHLSSYQRIVSRVKMIVLPMSRYALSFEAGNTDITFYDCLFEDNLAEGDGGGNY